jgi:hypothetical protein
VKQVQSSKPNPQTTCQVCRAARELVQATDGLRNAGMAPNPELTARVKSARKNWAYSRGQRHTGAVHTPVVAP